MAILIWFLALLITHKVQSCPESCSCGTPDGYINNNSNKTISLVKTVCQHAPQLTSIPQAFSKNLGVLVFKSNGLRGLINESLSKYRYLKELDFSNNQIEEITSGAFAKQSYLKKLILQDNHLKILPREVFSCLVSLEYLYLQNNYISRIPNGVFRYLKPLKTLHLHDNNLISIEEGTFDGLDFLKELDISGNFIKKIGPGLIANLMSLEIINLSYNDIQIIDDHAFRCSPLIKKLHLNNNSLVEIPAIHLLRYLEELDVSENPITLIHTRTFQTNANLKSLNISFCEIKFLQKEALAGLNSLHTISLEGNPLHCDCRVHWIQSLMSSIDMFSRPELTVCKSPMKLAGRPIKETNGNDMKCNCNTCKQYSACKYNNQFECKCLDEIKHQNCDVICPIIEASKSKQNCEYVDGHCLCSNKSLLQRYEEPKCHFEITNETCSENAHLAKEKDGNILRCVCDKGFHGDGLNCSDKNECNDVKNRCNLISKTTTICRNTLGSYECACREGFDGSSPFCVDVDECKDTTICGNNAVCLNTKGSYLCNCKSGFTKYIKKCYPLFTKEQINVTLLAINSSAIQVQWTILSPAKNMISFYEILYRPFGASTIKKQKAATIHSVNATSYILANLQADTSYGVWVSVSMVYNTSKAVLSTWEWTETMKREIPHKDRLQTATNLDIVLSIIGVVIVLIILVVLIGLYRFKKKRDARREDDDNGNSHLDDLIELRSEGSSALCERERKRSKMKSAIFDAWEIPRDQLKIGDKIGEGHFGVVLQGTLTSGENIIKVAVKTIKEADRFDMKDFILEMEMMKEIGYHPNVVSLLGVSSIGTPLYIITEYVDGGNLLDLLRSSRSGSSKYTNVVSSLNSRDLLNIALGVSKGMRHVASKKLVHRDLAARNVLMTKDLVAKIGDFGLARDVYCEGVYVKTGGGRLPIKWMAPESIKDRAYTMKSDIWSFGVLLWEIVTLGGSPYPSIPVNILLEKLLYGYRMPKPDNCADEVYDIMEDCWGQDPTSRPDFDFLCKELLGLLSEEGRTYINVKGLAIDELGGSNSSVQVEGP